MQHIGPGNERGVADRMELEHPKGTTLVLESSAALPEYPTISSMVGVGLPLHQGTFRLVLIWRETSSPMTKQEKEPDNNRSVTDTTSNEQPEPATLGLRSSTRFPEPAKASDTIDATTASKQNLSHAETARTLNLVSGVELANKTVCQNVTEAQQPRTDSPSAGPDDITSGPETSLAKSLRLGTNLIWTERHLEKWKRNCYDYTVDLIAKGIINNHELSREEVNWSWARCVKVVYPEGHPKREQLLQQVGSSASYRCIMSPQIPATNEDF